MSDRTSKRRFDPHHGIPNALRNEPRLLELDDDDRARVLGYVSILHAVGNETSLCSLLPLKVATREVRLEVLRELESLDIVEIHQTDVRLRHYDGSNYTRDERADGKARDRERHSRGSRKDSPKGDPGSDEPPSSRSLDSPILASIPHSAPSLNGTEPNERNGTEDFDVQGGVCVQSVFAGERGEAIGLRRASRANRFSELWTALLADRRTGRSESDFRRPCPAHDGDGRTTLHVVVHGNSPHRVIKAKCFSTNCDFKRIAEALGFLEADGFESPPPINWRSQVRSYHNPNPTPAPILSEEARAKRKRDSERESALYLAKRKNGWRDFEIKNRGGETVAVHRRCEFLFEGKRDKAIRWAGPNGSPGLPPDIALEDLPFFGSERLHPPMPGGPPRTALIVEGVAKADRLAKRLSSEFVILGTVTGSAKTHSAAVCNWLTGWRVVLWPDNDEAGFEHMRKLAAKLRQARVGELLYIGPTGAPGSGHDCRDFIDEEPATARERLLELVRTVRQRLGKLPT